jgi:hypothetical protein
MDPLQLPIHLHNCKPRLQHVLVWSKDETLFQRSLEFIKLEFDNNLYPVTIADIPTVIERIEEHEIEDEIEKYNFHVIKVHTDRVELLLKNNERHVIEDIEELEDALELLGQKIIRWYWDNQY